MSDSTRDFDAMIESLVKEREDAREAENYERADEIRDQLEDLGIVLMDDDGETEWRRREE
jgi:cysteinyl-tRNA synthetase